MLASLSLLKGIANEKKGVGNRCWTPMVQALALSVLWLPDEGQAKEGRELLRVSKKLKWKEVSFSFFLVHQKKEINKKEKGRFG